MLARVAWGCLLAAVFAVFGPVYCSALLAEEKPPLAPPEEPEEADKPLTPEPAPAKTVPQRKPQAAEPAAENDDAPASSDGEYLLRYKFEPNQFVHYEVVDKMSITTQKGSVTQTATNESRTRKHYRVKSVDEDGSGMLEPTIDHVHMTAEFSGEAPIVYDSAVDNAPPPQFLRVKETIGHPLANLKIKPNGALIKVSALHPVLTPNRTEQVKPDQDEAEQSEKEGDSLEAPAIDPNLNFLVVFPEKSIKIGESWKDRITVKVSVGDKLQRDVELSRRYTLQKVEGDLATIRMQMSVLTPINDPMVRGQLIQRTPSGTIVFDMRRGVIVSRDQELDKVEVGVAGADSSVRAVSHRTERLLSDEEVAKRVAETAGTKETERE